MLGLVEGGDGIEGWWDVSVVSPRRCGWSISDRHRVRTPITEEVQRKASPFGLSLQLPYQSLLLVGELEHAINHPP